MRNRSKIDWSKPFIFIDDKQKFDELDNEDSLVINVNAEETKPKAVLPYKKQDIPVPQIQKVPRIGKPKSFAKVAPNYIRLPPHLNLPLATRYELTQVDHLFLRAHQHSYVLRGKKVLTPQLLENVFVELEMKAGKDMTLPRNKGWLLSYFQRQYKDLMQMEKFEQFAETIYNYWKSRREELQFPLLRLLWKPSADEYNHMLAFRPRQREKRSLRRTTRLVEDQIIEELFEEFDLALKACHRVQARQEMKLKQVQLQCASFHHELRQFGQVPSFVQELKSEDKQKDKERMRQLHQQLDRFKADKQTVETVPMPTAPQIDTQESLVNFLATVVADAEALGLSYEKIFNPTIAVPHNESRVDKGENPGRVDPGRGPEPPKPPEAFMDINVSRFGEYILRQFEGRDDPQVEDRKQYTKPCRDYLEYKRRSVAAHYYGSDDEGETKDLKKNISASFKKFMQLQQINRSFSAVSEH